MLGILSSSSSSSILIPQTTPHLKSSIHKNIRWFKKNKRKFSPKNKSPTSSFLIPSIEFSNSKRKYLMVLKPPRPPLHSDNKRKNPILPYPLRAKDDNNGDDGNCIAKKKPLLLYDAVFWVILAVFCCCCPPFPIPGGFRFGFLFPRPAAAAVASKAEVTRNATTTTATKNRSRKNEHQGIQHDHQYSYCTNILLETVSRRLLAKLQDVQNGKDVVTSVEEALKDVKLRKKELQDQIMSELYTELRAYRAEKAVLLQRSEQILDSISKAKREEEETIRRSNKNKGDFALVVKHKIAKLREEMKNGETEYHEIWDRIGEIDDILLRRETMALSIGVRELSFIERECEQLVAGFLREMRGSSNLERSDKNMKKLSC